MESSKISTVMGYDALPRELWVCMCLQFDKPVTAANSSEPSLPWRHSNVLGPSYQRKVCARHAVLGTRVAFLVPRYVVAPCPPLLAHPLPSTSRHAFRDLFADVLQGEFIASTGQPLPSGLSIRRQVALLYRLQTVTEPSSACRLMGWCSCRGDSTS